MTRAAALLVAGGLFLALLVLGPRVAYGNFGPLWATTPMQQPAPKVVIGSNSDVYELNNCTPLNAFESWLGITPGSSYPLVYGPVQYPSGGSAPSLAQMESALLTNQCGYATRPLEISGAINDSEAAIVGGTYDTYLANLGTAINTYDPTAILRWDFEFNGSWNYYDVNGGGAGGGNYTPAAFVSAWQHVVSKVRSTAPNVKFEWTPSFCSASSGSCSNNSSVVAAYPGDSYVDIIGIDIYDLYESGGGAAIDWQDYWLATSTDVGLTWQVAFARQHNKLMDFGEWGMGSGKFAANGFSCANAACLDDAQAAALMPYVTAWLKNSGNVNGYRPYTEFDYWNTNEGGYCGIVAGSNTCPGGVSPFTAGGTPPSSFSSQYMNPQMAQAFYTAFHGWQ